MKINCQAGLWKVVKDHQGEVILTFKIPQMEAKQVILLPEETELTLTIEWRE